MVLPPFVTSHRALVHPFMFLAGKQWRKQKISAWPPSLTSLVLISKIVGGAMRREFIAAIL